MKKSGGAGGEGEGEAKSKGDSPTKYELVSVYDTPEKMEEIDSKMKVIERLNGGEEIYFTIEEEETVRKPSIPNTLSSFLTKNNINVNDLILEENKGKTVVEKYKTDKGDVQKLSNIIRMLAEKYFKSLENYEKIKQEIKKGSKLIDEDEDSYRWKKQGFSKFFKIFPKIDLHNYIRDQNIEFFNGMDEVTKYFKNIGEDFLDSIQEGDEGFIPYWLRQFNIFIEQLKDPEKVDIDVWSARYEKEILKGQEYPIIKNYMELIKKIAKQIKNKKEINVSVQEELKDKIKLIFEDLHRLLDLKQQMIANVINEEYTNSNEDRHEIVLNYCSGGNIYMLLPPFILINILNNLKNESGNEPSSKYTIFSLCGGNFEGDSGMQINKVREDINLIQSDSFIKNIVTVHYKNEKKGEISDSDQDIIQKRCGLFKERLKIVYIQVPIINEGFNSLFNTIFNILKKNNKILSNQIIHFHCGFSGLGELTKLGRFGTGNLPKIYNGEMDNPKLFYYFTNAIILSTKNLGKYFILGKENTDFNSEPDLYFYNGFTQKPHIKKILENNPYTIMEDIESGHIEKYRSKVYKIEDL